MIRRCKDSVVKITKCFVVVIIFSVVATESYNPALPPVHCVLSHIDSRILALFSAQLYTQNRSFRVFWRLDLAVGSALKM